MLHYLETEINFNVLAYFTKGISGITPYLHRNVVRDVVLKLKNEIERHIFSNPEMVTK